MDRNWISMRLKSLQSGLADNPEDRRKVLAAISRMFLVYPAANSDVDVAKARLQTYMQVLNDLDAETIVAVIERWLRGDVPNAEAKRYPATPAAIHDLARSMPSARKTEMLTLRRLLDARVVPVRSNDPVSIEERRRYAETMRKMHSGEIQPEKSRKAVDL